MVFEISEIEKNLKLIMNRPNIYFKVSMETTYQSGTVIAWSLLTKKNDVLTNVISFHGWACTGKF